MGLTQTTNYDVAGNFTFDSSLIEFVGGVARLKTINNPGQTFTQAFSADTGFTYDNTKAEFTGGVVRQKDLRPANATFYASYTSSINGNWGVGVLTGTPTGSVSIVGGFLELIGGVSDKYADYSATSNADSLQVGCVRMVIKPAYSGSPSTNQMFLRITQAVGSSNNALGFFHSTTGQISIRIFSNTGATIISTNIGAWVPVSGTSYELEFNWDITTGASRFFIDGVQLGSTLTQTGTRSGAVGLLRIGETQTPASNFSNFSVSSIVAFSTVQHTANYTPGAAIAENVYEGSTVTCPTFSYSGLGNIQAFTAASITDTNSPRYIINDKYHDGSSWVVSNGSFSQANTASQIVANIATFQAINSVVVKVVFNTSNTTQMSTDNLQITYTGQIKSTADPTVTINSALILDALESFSSVLTASGSDAIKFTVLVAGPSGGSFTEYYWNGAAWVTANGTYAQSNTAAEINTNGPAFSFLSTGKQIKIKAYLHSATGLTTPDITSYTIGYSFFAVELIPGECIVYGWLLRQDGTAISGATVRIRNPSPFMHSGNLIPVLDQTTTTNSAGYWEISLIETETVGASYTFSFETSEVNEKDAKYGGVVVPNDEFALFSTLVP